MKNKKILIICICIFNFIFSDNSTVEYLIYTNPEFSIQANEIKQLYEEDILDEFSLITQILYTNTISPSNLSSYLFNPVNNYIHHHSLNITRSYLSKKHLILVNLVLNPTDLLQRSFNTACVSSEANTKSTDPAVLLFT